MGAYLLHGGVDLSIFAGDCAVGLERTVNPACRKNRHCSHLCDTPARMRFLPGGSRICITILVIRRLHILLEQVGQVILLLVKNTSATVSRERSRLQIVADISQKIGQHTVA